MLRCLSPLFLKSQKLPVACGSCFFCRVKKRNAWTGRLMMELQSHTDAVFVTLTYETLPNPPYLSKRDIQLFFKRLRKALGKTRRIRYYVCGEYGSLNFRPHYHAIIFGLSEKESAIIRNAWSLGFISCGSVSMRSIAYVAGYVTKKFKDTKDYKDSGECKVPEFALMSRRPALGSPFIKKLLPFALSQSPLDVLRFIEIGGKIFWLDKTIRDKLRKEVFTDDYIDKLKQLGKEAYALSISEKMAEIIAPSVGQDYLDYFFSDDERTSSFNQHAREVFKVLELNREELEQERSFALRRINRKDL